MKSILTIILSFLLAVSTFAQTRNVVVGTNGAIVQPTNFWSADVTNARSGLGLGTAATNPVSAFQPSSSVLSNLSLGDGSGITNISTTNLIGVLSILNGGTGSTNASGARSSLGLGSAATNQSSAFQPSSGVLSNLASSNAINLTNVRATNIVGTVALASNISAVVAITNGGSGETTAGGARTNFGLGATWLTNTNVTNFRTSIGLGATNNVTFANIESVGTLTMFGISGIVFDDTEAADTTRANLGFSTNLNTLWTATNASNARTAIGLGATGSVSFEEALISNALEVANGAPNGITIDADGIQFGSTNAAITRTNLGLGWSALTNTNDGTGLVSVNTNGDVVSPTNFWQNAPIKTTFIESQPTTNSTTNISPSRLLHIHSLATNIVNTTNTIALPTNTLTFEGDMALVVHKGPTSSLTQVRQAGSTNNLITLNKFNEAVEFTYYNNTWQFLETAAFTAPIYFSGTNATANAAASRTNLGLGANSAVTFNFVNATSGAVSPNFESGSFFVTDGGYITFEDTGTIYFNSAAPSVRTNLGLPFAALTNTNAAGFQRAIFSTNSVPTNSANINTINFNTAVAWMEVSVITNGVTNSYRIPLFQ